MRQRFCHIYTYILRTLFYCQYFEIETSVPFVQTGISGNQAIFELRCSRRMPKWQYFCEVFCFLGKHKNPSKGWWPICDRLGHDRDWGWGTWAGGGGEPHYGYCVKYRAAQRTAADCGTLPGWWGLHPGSGECWHKQRAEQWLQAERCVWEDSEGWEAAVAQEGNSDTWQFHPEQATLVPSITLPQCMPVVIA